MASESVIRTPFDVFSFVPEGHEKALKQALYNTLTILFVIFAATAVAACYFILQPFFQPLLWAVLFGSVLHPFKRRLSLLLAEWLRNQKTYNRPLAISIITLPLNIMDDWTENVLRIVLTYLKFFVGGSVAVLAGLIAYHFLPANWLWRLLVILRFFYYSISMVVDIISVPYMMITIVAGYTLMVCFWWNDQSKQLLVNLSPFVWGTVFCYCMNLAGPFRLPLLLCGIVLLVLGLVAEIRGEHECDTSKDSTNGQADEVTMYPNWFVCKIKVWYLWLKSLFFEQPPEPENDLLSPEEAEEELYRRRHGRKRVSFQLTDGDLALPGLNQKIRSREPTPEPGAEDHLAELVNAQTSPRSIRRILRQHSDSHEDTPEASPPESLRANLPRITVDTSPDVTDGSERQQPLSNIYLCVLLYACVLAQLWCHIWLLHLLSIPCIYMIIKRLGPVHGAWRLLKEGEKRIVSVLETSVDSFTSIMVILMLFFLAIVGTVFLCVQVYGESVHLIQVTSGLINSTVVYNPELQQLLPDTLQNVQGALDSMMGDAYKYGREWITSTLRRVIDEKDEVKAAQMERQIIELWDRVYQLWLSRNNETLTDHIGHNAPSWDNLVDGLKTLDFDVIITFVKENIGIFMSVLESVWTILKGNISVAMSFITALFSLLFGGGTAVLNFLLNMIIFTTALFYLLTASGARYKPVELFSRFLPSQAQGSPQKVGEAVEQAINGVFAASFKMATFYGLYTWLIHTLFNVRIVYIPSALAAIFGAVPFIGAYWACLPAVMELWLVNGQLFKAGLMAAAQLAPTYFVDSAIYSEIKGGSHPFLTGLAIAGGVFCLGFEGALFGPILLCVLIVIMNVYTHMVQSSSSTMSGVPLRRPGRMNSLG